MKYRSTRGGAPPVLISEALWMGLAPDGGLFVPSAWPIVNLQSIAHRSGFADFAAEILAPFFSEDSLQKQLPHLCTEAFDFPMPMTEWNADTQVLELFHGPTNAFKDFGARFLALATPPAQERRRLVLVATSGDTGGAVAGAFSEITSLPVLILYPKGRISARQEKQLSVWGDRVFAVAVNADFDACQKLVKDAFASDNWANQVDLLSANSINLGRLLPQMATFAFASLKFFERTKVAPGVIVPSGNAGNATAALWARKLGFPIRKVIFAHNANGAIPEYFRSGDWTPKPTVATYANAMDVGAPSNFERVRDLFPNVSELRQVASAHSVSDDEIKKTILEEAGEGRLFCPHTATAVHVRKMQKDGNWIIAATAHPAKFETILEPWLERKIELPRSLEALLHRPGRSFEIENSATALERFCREHGLL